MTIPKEAINAAAEALFDEAQELDQENSWGDPLPDEWRESWRDAAREAIEAALPHLREHIAQEIEAIPNNYPAGPRNIWAKAITTAAQIARGKDQS